jgi:hypothetical protein
VRSFPPGWELCDYDLVSGEWEGEEYEYEIWVLPARSASSRA